MPSDETFPSKQRCVFIFLSSIERYSMLLFFCFALKLFLVCFWQVGYLNFIVGVITNLQSLNPEHTGKSIVC